MHTYNAEETAQALPYKVLIAQMEALFAAGVKAPVRHHHTLASANEPDQTLLLMPVWQGDIGCVKLVTVTPGNRARQLPAVMASVLVFDRHTGEHLALLDGSTLTNRRTAAASALAAKYLAPEQADRLLLVGAGQVAEQLPAAFSAVRPIRQVEVWNRTRAGAERLVARLNEQGFTAQVVDNLAAAAGQADIISAATLATEPVIKGEWLKDTHQHLDLIGAFTPQMREADNTAISRAHLYVDTWLSVKEAGELAIPITQGVIGETDILGDLYSLCQVGPVHSGNGLTLFKGAGNAVMDLAGALTARERLFPL